MTLKNAIFGNRTKQSKSTNGNGNGIRVPPLLMDVGRLDANNALQQLNATVNGLSEAEVESRQKKYGFNDVAREKHLAWWKRLLIIIRNPLVVLFIILSSVSYATGDIRATIMIMTMATVSVMLRFFQENNADKAAEELKAMVHTTATVLRYGQKKEVALRELVPGDIVQLAAGDMVPAEIRLLFAKDLYINQAALTGESLPVEKYAGPVGSEIQNAFEMPNLAFLGSNVESGAATGLVVLTGSSTYFGSLSSRIVGQRTKTSFDIGVNSFTWLMITFILIMVPLVVVINGLSKGDWIEALLFGLAVAVGLTPEMLPMIVTVNLSRGAITMSRKKVIVKNLSAIQNFGALDILCTDKTGTITQGRIVLEKYLDIYGDRQDEILNYAYLNSYFQTGLKNLLDVAVLRYADLEEQVVRAKKYRKIDEIPFDFVRKRMSVIVEDEADRHMLICKGAFEEVMKICSQVEVRGRSMPLMQEHRTEASKQVKDLNEDGFRVIALGYKLVSNVNDNATYNIHDESDLILMGFMAFYDPPKETASEALQRLHKYNIQVKILTGDNEVVTNSICRQVDLTVERIMLGPTVEAMSDEQLANEAESVTVFAKLSPIHKERIIRALKLKGHVVGFLGDGINDAPALKAADVGISVDTAVDIAKESSSIILLETSLLVLAEGVIEGRRIFGNIIKYIKMAASSNFGNMFSVIGASAFLPFLPMLPLQVLVNNLLYDFSQLTIPTDRVDEEWIAKPRQWSMGNIRRFIIFIGPISSIFDYTTYFIMLYVFNTWANPELFHTGWFVESLFTQTLIIHIIRTNKIPFIQSRASWAMIFSTIAIVSIGAGLTISPLASSLGFVPLPPLYWLLLLGMLLCYVTLTQIIKMWFIKKFGD